MQCAVVAGNTRREAAQYYPASVSKAVTVAAIDSRFMIAADSNYGTKVDLLAPGISVLSAWKA